MFTLCPCCLVTPRPELGPTTSPAPCRSQHVAEQGLGMRFLSGRGHAFCPVPILHTPPQPQDPGLMSQLWGLPCFYHIAADVPTPGRSPAAPRESEVQVPEGEVNTAPCSLRSHVCEESAQGPLLGRCTGLPLNPAFSHLTGCPGRVCRPRAVLGSGGPFVPVPQAQPR